MLFLEIIIVIFFGSLRGRVQIPQGSASPDRSVEVVRGNRERQTGKGLGGLGGDLSLVLRLSALFTARRPCLASCQG